MRRLLTPSTSVPCVIIAAVIAMVVSANIREGRREPAALHDVSALGAPGAPSTTREGLARRITEMESRLAARPDDVGAAVLLADALIRQSRVTGNAGLTHAGRARADKLRSARIRATTTRCGCRARCISRSIEFAEARWPSRRSAARCDPTTRSTTACSATRISSSATTTKRSMRSIG